MFRLRSLRPRSLPPAQAVMALLLALLAARHASPSLERIRREFEARLHPTAATGRLCTEARDPPSPTGAPAAPTPCPDPLDPNLLP